MCILDRRMSIAPAKLPKWVCGWQTSFAAKFERQTYHMIFLRNPVFMAMRLIQTKHAECRGQRTYRFDIIGDLVALISIAILLSACVPPEIPDQAITYEPGQVSAQADDFGVYYTYVPTTIPEQPDILVLVHGTPKDDTAEANAEYCIRHWLDFAEAQGYILIAPAFNQEDFSSRYGDHALSGYRGLFGREIGADEWVLRLVEAHQQASDSAGEPFSMYGHSAGGQFTGRFLVTHPRSIKKAVITSAATYPQPNVEIPWPFGIGELHGDIAWDDGTCDRPTYYLLRRPGWRRPRFR